MSDIFRDSRFSNLFHFLKAGNFGAISHFDLSNSDEENQRLYQLLNQEMHDSKFSWVKLIATFEFGGKHFLNPFIFSPTIQLNSLLKVGMKLQILTFLFSNFQSLETYNYNQVDKNFEIEETSELESFTQEELFKKLFLFQFKKEIRTEIKIISLEQIGSLSFNEVAYGKKKPGQDPRLKLL